MAVSIQDQSQTASGATSSGSFNPVFGSVALPANNTAKTAIIAGAVIIGLLVWKGIK